MSERTLADPLSGAEVVEAIVEKVRLALRRDGNLNPALAYEAFSARIRLEVKLKDCGRMVDIQTVANSQSENPVDEDAALVEAEALIYEQPPNQVRHEAGLAIPTLVVDGEGRKTVEKIKYARKRTGEDVPAEAEGLEL